MSIRNSQAAEPEAKRLRLGGGGLAKGGPVLGAEEPAKGLDAMVDVTAKLATSQRA